MTNPERVDKRTPNGGDFSEMYYLDKDGNLAESMKTATQFRILEKKENGEIVQETYGKL